MREEAFTGVEPLLLVLENNRLCTGGSFWVLVVVLNAENVLYVDPGSTTLNDFVRFGVILAVFVALLNMFFFSMSLHLW